MPNQPHASHGSKRFAHTRLWLLAALFAAGLPLAPASAQQDSTPPIVTLRGRVVDTSNGQPLPDASVEVRNLQLRVVSDERGEFSLAVPRGSHLVRFMGMGYDTLSEMWTAAENDAGIVVQMTPKPLLLQAIRVQSRMLERRLDRLTVQTRAFDKEQIRQFGHAGTIDFLELYAGVRPSVCGTGGTGCAVVRGRVEPIVVYVDELPSVAGLDELRSMPLQEIHRIEVLEGGAHLRVYTRDFVLRLAQRGSSTLRPIQRNTGPFQTAAQRVR